MLKKGKIAIVLALTRRNASPAFCALLPQVRLSLNPSDRYGLIESSMQEERKDETGWADPAGFHLIPLPFADDIRMAPIEEAFRGIVYFQ